MAGNTSGAMDCMRRSKYRIVVDGESYFVTERPGYLKADLDGFGGWTSVWSDTVPNLMRRIRQARRGGQ
jgi:hypothetical protein